MTPKGHAIPSKTQLLSYGTPAFPQGLFVFLIWITNVNHSGLYRPDLYNITGVRRVNHLSISYVDTAVSSTGTDITRLWIADSRPSKERICGSDS